MTTKKERATIYGQPMIAAIHYMGRAGLTLEQAAAVLKDNGLPVNTSLKSHLPCATRTAKTSAPVARHREVIASYDAATRAKILDFKKLAAPEAEPVVAAAAEAPAPAETEPAGKPLLPQPKAGKTAKPPKAPGKKAAKKAAGKTPAPKAPAKKAMKKNALITNEESK